MGEETALTRDDLDEIGAPLPDVGAIIDDDDHGGVYGEEAMEALLGHT